MPAYNFSEKFIALIREGVMKSTVLPTSNRAVSGTRAYFFEVGDEVRVSGYSIVSGVTPIILERDRCLLDGAVLSDEAASKLAVLCGFGGYMPMVHWYQEQFKLPFKGYLHQWK